MQSSGISLMLLTLATFVAAGQYGNYTHQTYIIPTEPASELASHCPSNRTQCLTLNDLIDSSPGKHGMFQLQEEVIFLSGIHVVDETRRKYLSAIQIRDLLLRGETNNVTITCRKEFHLRFVQAARIQISNLTLHNCSMNGNITHSRSVYCCDFTLLFIGLEGDMTLDNIQLTSDSKHGVAIYLKASWGDYTATHMHVQLINVKLSAGIFIASHNIYLLKIVSLIEISNSSFNGSCIEVQASTNVFSAEILDVMVKNTSFGNCSHWPALTFRGADRPLSVTLHDVNVSDNRSPYVMYANQTTIHLQGNLNLFNHNRGVVYIVHSKLLFSRTKTEFVNNNVNNTHGVPVYAANSVLVFKDSYIVFKNNHGSVCGGIIGTTRTQLLFMDNSTLDFEKNKGQQGGALSLNKQSVLRFNTSVSNLKTELHFTLNEAQTGGAIFVKDKDYISTIDYQLQTSVLDIHNADIKLKFSNNLAQIGGNQIYGGWVDWFVGEDGVARYNPNISRSLEFEDDTDISSDPIRVCMCVNKTPNCSITEYQKDIYGQAFSIDLVAVGQRFGTVIFFVQAKLKDKPQNQERVGKISERQKVQIVQWDCTTLKYTITSDSSEETLMIMPLKKANAQRFDADQLQEHPDHDILFQQFSVKLKIKNCPIGFVLHDSNHHCTCRPSLAKHHLECDLNDYQIQRSEQQWVGVTYNHTTINEYPGVIAHQHCPFDYCKTDKESLLIRLEDQDEQCAFNRAGILCGGCKTGFSIVLGSSRCKKCSNLMVLAIIPSFLLSGLLLVIFLMLLNLTVSVCLLYTSPSPRDATLSRMPSSA